MCIKGWCGRVWRATSEGVGLLCITMGSMSSTGLYDSDIESV